MVFAQMVVSDEDAVICDFLQYYQIMDYRSLPLQRAAILACGLPEDSRTMRSISGRKCTNTELYLMALIDSIRSLQYLYTKVHSKGHVAQPKSLIDIVLGKEDSSSVQGFDSPEAFEAARNRIING